MKVIRPTKITDSILVSSSVPETDFAAWSSATTYAIGDKCIKGHRIWQSVQASNLNNDPETSGVSFWADIGPTNRWAMFDTVVGTQTTSTDVLTVVMSAGRLDSVALLNVDCSSISVDMFVGSDAVYSRTISMIDSGNIVDWYGYFFDMPIPRTDLVLDDLLVYGEGVLRIELTKAGTVSCGACIVGLKAEIGRTLTNPSVGILDYSTISRDDFGTPTLNKRSYSKRYSVKLVLTKSQVDYVFSILASYRATPMVWIGAENLYQSLVAYGYYKDFEIDIAYTTFSYCTLSIEGMN